MKKSSRHSSSEVVTNRDQFQQTPEVDRIFTFRGIQVIVDRDLADLYGVETKRLNQQANRNKERFPVRFRFQLSKEEEKELVANCNRFESLKHASSCPYVYTEQGVAMLSAVLHTPTAVEVSVKVIDAFVAMRRFLLSNAQVFQRLDKIEYKLLESDQKFEDIYSKLEEKSLEPRQGIFFDGQVFDSYSFISSLIRSATRRIILIDNYVDESVLTLMENTNPNDLLSRL